ncbi:MAG: hypothetical protein PHW31_01185 [Candidatus Pacebacteria bacterium]|nr:hypothetical protein [Candidatus Paceibacterota bacterium]
MDLSNIKKLVLEEGKVVIVDGDDALVVMSFDEYKKLKGEIKGKEGANRESLPLNFQPVDFKEEKPSEKPSENPSQDLTLDDLPF